MATGGLAAGSWRLVASYCQLAAGSWYFESKN